MHVDDFIDSGYENRNTGNKYARWFFLLARLPAIYQSDFRDQISKYKLFCSYQGERFRVTGASRLGDIWLVKDFGKDHGYDHRVDLVNCTNWSPDP